MSCIPWPSSTFFSSLSTLNMENSIPSFLSDGPLFSSFSEYMDSPIFQPVLTQFKELCLTSVRRRVLDTISKNHACTLLFSGGLDCSVLAALCHLVLPQTLPIYLINIAFTQTENNGTAPLLSPPPSPDRLTSQRSYEILKCHYPTRPWHLECITIHDLEVQSELSVVLNLLSPDYLTNMDLSLALPLYFATQHVKHSKVIVSGLGADELLGGYRRHRHVFEKSGWLGLQEELFMEVQRLGTRNLGRDDRIISHHGIEARYPYLDHHVVQFLTDLPIYLKCDPRLPLGQGDKLLLRLLAYQLGLKEISGLMKRAMQFGSKSAKFNLLPNEPGSLKKKKKGLGQLPIDVALFKSKYFD
ncbi:hypothetical protein HMI56_003121 [Coelomomyces lativittatus]|nr:hypothetical protein HMI56_003121 [Coelomomyces lativittatus]